MIEVIKPGHIRTTITTQTEADERIPALIATPAEFREVRVVPRELVRLDGLVLRGLINRQTWQGMELETASKSADWAMNLAGPSCWLNQITAAGETGLDARPSHPDWFRALRDECAAAGVKFVFEGWGEFRPAISAEEAGSYPVLTRNRAALPAAMARIDELAKLGYDLLYTLESLCEDNPLSLRRSDNIRRILKGDPDGR